MRTCSLRCCAPSNRIANTPRHGQRACNQLCHARGALRAQPTAIRASSCHARANLLRRPGAAGTRARACAGYRAQGEREGPVEPPVTAHIVHAAAGVLARSQTLSTSARQGLVPTLPTQVGREDTKPSATAPGAKSQAGTKGGSARTGCRPVGTVNARCESARRSTGIMTRISLLSIHSGPRAYHGPAPSLQTSGRGGIRGDDAFSPTGLDLMSPSRPRREGKGSGVRKAQPHPVPSAGWLSAGTQGADQR